MERELTGPISWFSFPTANALPCHAQVHPEDPLTSALFLQPQSSLFYLPLSCADGASVFVMQLLSLLLPPGRLLPPLRAASSDLLLRLSDPSRPRRPLPSGTMAASGIRTAFSPTSITDTTTASPVPG